LLEFRNGDQQKILPDEAMKIQVCARPGVCQSNLLRAAYQLRF
jgi:hypothetical protein